MTRFVEVSHTEWIAAPVSKVRAQFADLRHHIAANVHPKLSFEVLSETDQSARFVQFVRLLGIKQRASCGCNGTRCTSAALRLWANSLLD